MQSLYTTKDGKNHTYTRFVELPKLAPGYCWVDKSALGAGYVHFVETPNKHHKAADEIFGYSMRDLLAKQYR